MGKALLQKPSTLTPSKKLNSTVDADSQQATLKELLQQMDNQLTTAAKDLMQPRQQAIDAILSKAAHS